jgi:hypothetical protein
MLLPYTTSWLKILRVLGHLHCNNSAAKPGLLSTDPEFMSRAMLKL